MNKGFEFYKQLEKHLHSKNYEFFFAGQAPVKFKNNLGCLTSFDLSTQLNLSDVYVTASKNDPCSNSLLEAISCELPSIALNSGGHPELVSSDEMLFNNIHEAINLIEKICFDKNFQTNCCESKKISKVADEYLDFCRNIHEGN